MVLVWIGKKIDDVNILKFASFVIIFLSISCFIFSKISSVIFLFVGIFLMRLSGQGLSSHTATTTISRFFEKNRGRALSTGWLGLSLAEFVLPVLIVFLLTFIEWRDIWVSICVLVIIVLPIASFFLVKEVKLDTREESTKEAITKEIKQWKRIEVLKDYRFYIVCMTMLAMPWIATGAFVYQSFITSSKDWGPYVIAQSFMIYSILSVVTLFISGFLIDKFSSRKLLIYMNIPLFFSTAVLFYFDAEISSFSSLVVGVQRSP
jgi:Major Facilitator Superfamily.